MSDQLLVIGATSDIGSEFLKSKHNESDEIIALFHNKKLEGCLDDLKRKKIYKYNLDLNNLDNANSLGVQLSEKYDISKILHLAAPPFKQKNFEKIDINDVIYNLNVQLLSIIELLKPILKKMKKKKQGKIVFILSSVVLGVPPKYNSSWTKGLALT